MILAIIQLLLSFSTAFFIHLPLLFFIMEDATQRLKVEKLFPEKGKQYKKFMNNIIQISISIRSFFWQKTLRSLITGAMSYIILLIMGIEYAFLWAFLIFMFNFIPYIGPLFSSLFPATVTTS